MLEQTDPISSALQAKTYGGTYEGTSSVYSFIADKIALICDKLC